MNLKLKPTKQCYCPNPQVEEDICVKCCGLNPKISEKKSRRKK